MALPTPEEKSRQMKGNQNAKKDFTKEMGKSIISNEFWFLAKLLADIPAGQVNQFLKDNSIELSVLGQKTVEQIVKGNWKAAQWFWEMGLGKPKIVNEVYTPQDKSFKLKYKIDAT